MSKTYYVIIVILVLMAATCNAVMDVLQFRYSRSLFARECFSQSFWNPDLSWRNKWKNGNHEEGERFLGSSTVFVLFTDAWHLFQFLMFSCFELIIVLLYHAWKKPKLYVSALQFMGLKILFGFTFELFFGRILIV